MTPEFLAIGSQILANKSIQNKLDHKFQKRVESLKLARRPLKKVVLNFHYLDFMLFFYWKFS